MYKATIFPTLRLRPAPPTRLPSLFSANLHSWVARSVVLDRITSEDNGVAQRKSPRADVVLTLAFDNTIADQAVQDTAALGSGNSNAADTQYGSSPCRADRRTGCLS